MPVLLYLNAGLIIWLARFLFAYGFAAGACAHGWAEASVGRVGVVPLVLAAATLLAIGAALPFLWRGFRPNGGETAKPGFVEHTAALVAGIAIVAMIWETIPAFTVPVCG